MITALWIAAGGAVGTIARYGLSGMINQTSQPWGTVTVNLLGSFALGFLIGLWGMEYSSDQRLAATVGLLGGFTTFSAFSLETVSIWEAGHGVVAVASALVSVVGGLAAAAGGLALGRTISR